MHFFSDKRYDPRAYALRFLIISIISDYGAWLLPTLHIYTPKHKTANILVSILLDMNESGNVLMQNLVILVFSISIASLIISLIYEMISICFSVTGINK